MKYQVIARRYRPRRFDEVVGQESVALTLRNAILQERLAHAYLFAGPRGIGKTSMARIFAKALNCPRASDGCRGPEERGIPCDECEICRSIHSGDDIDVLEMDGASYRGIEEIRDIIENVKFIPSRSPYKIFIIDEVHMLTREAFNALLKTLEEPPGHVKFIFATTEPHKIPETVLSRCQRFDFRPISEEDIVRRLAQICQAEKVEAEPELLRRIARYGKGGLRDAQTLLDQAITFSDAVLKSEDLERITGRLPEAPIEAVVRAVEGMDPAGALRGVEECWVKGADPSILLEQVIESFHGKLLALTVGGGEGPKPAGDPRARSELDLLLGRLQVLNEAAGKLRSAPYPRLCAELAVVKLARMESPLALDEALKYLKGFEDRMGARPGAGAGPPRRPPAEPARIHGPDREAARRIEPPPASPPPAAPPPVPPATSEERVQPAAPATADPGPPAAEFDFKRLSSLWSQIIIESGQRFPKIAALLGRSRLKEGSERGRFLLILDSEFSLKQLKDPRRIREFEALVNEITGAHWRMAFELEVSSGPEGSPPARPGGGPEPGAPKPKGRKPEGKGLQDNPLVKKSVELFKGKII